MRDMVRHIEPNPAGGARHPPPPPPPNCEGGNIDESGDLDSWGPGGTQAAASRAETISIRRRSPRRRNRRNGRHSFQTAAALYLAAFFAAALLGLACCSRLSGGGAGVEGGGGRVLEDGGGGGGGGGDGGGNGDGGGGENGDYSLYSCDDIFELTEPGSSDRCAFASTCNGGDGLYVPLVFCNDSLSTLGWCLALSPLLLLWLVTLFRMLGTTAEDYFSPSLEMFSLKMGLPPRFAGVTLLALGNGAADVSATVSAFAMDPDEGYLMSLGALTGAGMFVGTVVAGAVIVATGGVPCRGALVRDVVAFIVTVVVAFCTLNTGSIGPGAVTAYFAMYGAFVAIVLIADVYHRAVVLPRLERETERREAQRQEEDGRGAQEAAGAAVAEEEEEEEAFADEPGTGPSPSLVPPAPLGRVQSTLEAGTEMRLDVPPPSPPSSRLPQRAASIRLMPGQPPSADGGGGSEAARADAAGENVPIRSRTLNRFLMALSNYDRYEQTGRVDADPLRAADGWGVDAGALEGGGGGSEPGAGGGERPLVLHGRDGLLSRHHHHHHEEVDDEYVGGRLGSSSPYTSMVDEIDLDNVCAEEGSVGFGAHSWRGAWHDGREELRAHVAEVWAYITDKEENSALDRFLLICELPFIVMRKLSVPIPCEGYYCRALVALSLAMSPLWIGTYFLVQHETNLFWLGGVPYVLIMLAVSVLCGALIMRYAPGGDANMALIFSGPIAFYGFVVAATWIDAIADQLVGLLGFLGVILRIPGSIMGLTVLAWGNSMGDLSANMTMARKGLANMAITACFAGPVFNILIGLGGGFSVLSSVTGEAVKEVHLTPSIKTGFFFLLCNCALVLVSGVVVNKGRIPAGYGYAALALYLVYIVASLVLQFSGLGGGY